METRNVQLESEQHSAAGPYAAGPCATGGGVPVAIESPASKPRWREQDVVGLKYFDQLLPLFQRLHDEGSARDRAGNRELH